MAEEEKDTQTAAEPDSAQESQEAAAGQTEEKESAKAKKNRAEKKLENEIEALRLALAKKEEELAGQNEKYLRVLAEYDNFRKRSRAEHESAYSDAYADAINALLPVLDNIERAASFEDGAKVLEGVKMTVKAFADALEKLGVTEIETASFDPRFHNAVMHVEDESLGEGTIVEVFQKGYKKGDKVIRHAMVKVAN